VRRPYLAIIPILVAASVFLIYTKIRDKTLELSEIKETTKLQIEKVDNLAAFAIYTNGLKRTFDDPKYLNLNESVYIDLNNTNIIHVKTSGITWRDFFDTLPMEVDYDCLTTGTGQKFCNGEGGNLHYIIDGSEANDFFEREIKDTDHALIIFGNESEAEIKQIFRDNIQPEALSPSM
jgi:hypothetical protein